MRRRWNLPRRCIEKLYAVNPNVAQYVVPNGFNRRVLAQFNLREAYAFCQLRSAANAHFSIRRIAQRIYEEMARVHPLLTKYMKLHDETWQGVEENYFTEVHKIDESKPAETHDRVIAMLNLKTMVSDVLWLCG